MIGTSREIKARVNKEIFDYRQSDNPYNGQWKADRYGIDVLDVDVPQVFEHNQDGRVTLLFDNRLGHIGYLGALWITDEFENEGLYLYVAETEDGKAQGFEYYQDAVNWLKEQH